MGAMEVWEKEEGQAFKLIAGTAPSQSHSTRPSLPSAVVDASSSSRTRTHTHLDSFNTSTI